MGFSVTDNAAGSALSYALGKANFSKGQINTIFQIVSDSPSLVAGIEAIYDANPASSFIGVASTETLAAGQAKFGVDKALAIQGLYVPQILFTGPAGSSSFSTPFKNPFAVGPSGIPTGELTSGNFTDLTQVVGTLAHEIGHFEEWQANPLFAALINGTLGSPQSSAYQQALAGAVRLFAEGYANAFAFQVSGEVAFSSPNTPLGELLVPVPAQDNSGPSYTDQGSLTTEQNIVASGIYTNAFALISRYAGDYGAAQPSFVSSQGIYSYAQQAFGFLNNIPGQPNTLPFVVNGASGVASLTFSVYGFNGFNLSNNTNQPQYSVTINFTNGSSTALTINGNTLSRNDSSGYSQTYVASGLKTIPGIVDSLTNSLIAPIAGQVGDQLSGAVAPANPDTLLVANLLSQLATGNVVTSSSAPDGSVIATLLNSQQQAIAILTTQSNGTGTLQILDTSPNALPGQISIQVTFLTNDWTQNYNVSNYAPTPGITVSTNFYGLNAVLLKNVRNLYNTSIVTDTNPADLAPGQLSIQTTYSGLGGTGKVVSTLVTNYDHSSLFTDLVNNIQVVSNAQGTAVSATSLNPDGEEIGGALGSVLGTLIGGNNLFGKLVVSPALQGVGEALGEFAETWINGATTNGATFETALTGGLGLLPSYVEVSSLSEIAGYLLGELYAEVGIKGEAAGLLNAVSGTYASVFAQNVYNVVTGALISTGVGNATRPATLLDNLTGSNIEINLGSAIGAYLGSQLAQAILTPSTDGGQIGEQIGSALGGVAATIAIADGIGASIITDLGGDFLAYVTVGAALGFVGAFVGAILGTLIGDVFGEAPSPQAYDNITLQNGPSGASLVASFRSQKDSGPVTSAAAIASAITTELNTVVQETGGKLSSTSNIPLFVVGLRKGTEELIDNHDHKFYGSGGVQQLINYAILSRLGDLVILGGDVYVKRAIAATAAGAFDSIGNLAVDTNAIAGNIKIAQDYEFYLTHEADVNAVIAGAPQSAAALGWAAELSEALALGLDKRNAADWNAGWDGFLQNQNADPATLTFTYSGNERVIANTATGAIIHDTIDSTGKSIIDGSATPGQTIGINGNTLLTPSTGTLTFNGTVIAANGTGLMGPTATTIPIAAEIYANYTGTTAGDTIYAGSSGNDVFGGNGGDLIYGFSAIPATVNAINGISTVASAADATWIWGGAGNDTIIAGISSGDYLNGGAGNDSIDARATNSVWINADIGNNTLLGGVGNDVLTAAGASTINGALPNTFYTDALAGGGGTDTYIVNPGTIDTINNTPVGKAGAAGTIELTGVASFSQVDAHAYTGTVTALIGSLEIDVLAPSTTGTSNTSNYTIAAPSTDVIAQIYVKNYLTNAADRVQYLQLSNGQRFDISNLGTNFIQGTPGPNFLEGTQGSDSIFGNGGTDTVEAFGGSDFVVGDGLLSGGLGNDTILGGNANDTIWGGPGSNNLDGGGGSNFILGAAFDTKVADINTIHGGAAGTGGVNTVIGGPQGNLIEYSLGDGAQVVYSSLATSAWHTVWTSAGSWYKSASDTSAEFGRDTTSDAWSGDITLTAQGATDLGLPQGTAIFYASQTTLPGGTVVAANTQNGVVDVEDNYARISNTGAGQGAAESSIYWQPTLTSASNTMTNLQFGVGITPDQLLFQQSGNDLLIGINDGNTNPNGTSGTFGALADQVTIHNYFTTGAIGSLQFVASSGATTTLNLSSAGSAGYIIEAPTVASGNGTISAPVGATSAQTYWITGGYGNDLLIGGPGNDILTAGPNGIDTLEGSGGSDTLIGTGQTWASYQNATAGVSASLANQPTSFTYAPNAHRAGLGNLSLAHAARGSGVLGIFSAYLQRQAGQQTLTAAQANAAANTTYVGITGLIGSAFNDTLTAAAGGSSLDGGGGSDSLVGGAGNDDFVYNFKPTGASAYGSDTIQLGGGADTLDIVDVGGPGVTFDQLAFASNNGTLVISQGGHTLTVLGLTSAGETLTLALDGDVSATFSGLPTSGNVGLAVGGAAASTVKGGSSLAGAVIAGGPANNTFIGLSGADTFIAGNETVAGGAGQDVITGANAGPSVNGGVTANTVSFAGASLGVTLALANGASSVAGGGATGDVLRNIQNLIGSSKNDSLTGDAHANKIDGGYGNDTIIGGGGNDTLIGNGRDLITSDVGNALLSVADCTIAGVGSTLVGGAGNDTLYGGAGNDILSDTGISGTTTFNSSLNGGGGNDSLTGYGNDTLDGGGGRDTVVAVTGNSLVEDSNSQATLVGGTGMDTLFAGSGNNVIFAGVGNSVLVSDQASTGGLSQTGTISATNVNTLWAEGITWTPATGPSAMTPADLTLAGNDTFELSSQSGTTVLHASYGVNEIEFDTSVNYADLVFTRNGTALDISDSHIAAPFQIVLAGFFNNSIAHPWTAPAFRDITDNGQVLFLSQFANSPSNTWVTSSSGIVAAGTSALTWEPTVSATDTVSGIGGPSVLKGSEFNGIITSYDNDTIANDTIVANEDTLIAGGGTNVITGSSASAVITGGSVADTITGGTASNTITGGSGAESITGGATSIANTKAVNIFIAGSGSDTINGAASANVNIYGGSGADLLEAGSGNTTIHGGSGSDTIFGGTGTDVLLGGTGAATITSGVGITSIVGGVGPDIIYGAGFDTIRTGIGVDTIHLRSASGTTYLNAANATVYGGWGSDTIDMTGTVAGTRDLIDDVSDTGGGGTVGGSVDVLQGAGIDTILGGEGTTVDFTAAAAGVVVNTALGSASGAAAGDVITNVGTLIGSSASDNLTASNLGSVLLIGGQGNDTLSAGIGSDTLQDVAGAGPAGNDSLYGYNWSNSTALAVSSATDTFNVYNGTNTIYGGNNANIYNILGGNATIQQATRPTGTSSTIYTDLIKVGASNNNSLTLAGPAAYTGTIVQTELSFLYSNLHTYDLWFAKSASGSDLVVTVLGAAGVDETVTLRGWFTNTALQTNLANQLFDAVSLPGTYALSSIGTKSSYATGVTVLAVNGLVAVDSQLAMPATDSNAGSLYNSGQTVVVSGANVSFKSALDPLWTPNHRPTIGFSGASNGTITEQVSSSQSASVLTFGVTVGDVETPANGLVVTATSPFGSVSASTPVAGTSPFSGTSLVTFTLNNNQDWQVADIPIVVTVTDGGQLSATETFTTSVVQVNPPPTFVSTYGSLTFNEGGTVGARGASNTVQVVVDHLTSLDVDDASSILLTAVSSNQALISQSDIHLSRSSGGTWNVSFNSEPGVYGSDTITFTALSNAAAVNGGSTTATYVTTVNVAEAAVTPVISVATSETYNETSTAGTYYIPFSIAGANVYPGLSVARGANAFWLTPTIINSNGQLYIQLVEAANSWTNWGVGQPNFLNSNITLTATANQGAVGTTSTTATIQITSNYVHQDFTVNAPAPITLSEGSGFSELTGLGSFTETPTNQDTFTYSLTSNPGGDFFVDSHGTIFQANPITWNPPTPTSSNTYTLGVNVSNGTYAHYATTTVTVKDADAPRITFSATDKTDSKGGEYIVGIKVTATDNHGLQSSLSVSSNLDPYSFDSVSWNGSSTVGSISVADGPTVDQVAETITVTATNSQGISTTSGYSFKLGDPNATPHVISPDQTSQMVAAMSSFVSNSHGIPDTNHYLAGDMHVGGAVLSVGLVHH